MKTKKVFIILGLLFILASFLRFYALSDNLFFGPEQGRDLLVVKDLVINHKLVLIGSKTDVDGVFHGPLFYYLSSIPFLLSQGNPVFITGFFILLHSATIFLIYLLGKDFFNKWTGYIAALLYTVSFGSIVYSRWLSNPPLSIPFSVIFFYFLHRYLQGNRKYLLFTALAFGLTFQVEFINLPFLSLIILIVLFVCRKKFLKENVWILVGSFLLVLLSTFGSYILFDLRHDYLITNNLIALVYNPTQYFSFMSTLNHASKTFIQFISDFVLPINSLVFPMIVVLIWWMWRREYRGFSASVFLLILWIFVPLITLIVLRHDVIQHFFLLSGVGVILATAVFIEKIFKRNFTIGALILFLVVGLHMYMWISNIPENKNIYFQTTQAELKYADQKKVISWVYQEGKSEPFDIQSYTIPYWSQQAWEYLFWYSGKQKNYFPTKEAKNLFVIIQEDPSSQSFQEDWLTKTVSKWGEKEKIATFGALTVEKLRTK